MSIDIRFRMETTTKFRDYSPGSWVGTIYYHANQWHWWSYETEWTTEFRNGFASFEEAIKDFAQYSHPEKLEFSCLKDES